MDEVLVRQEGPHVRVTVGRLNFLFKESVSEVIRETYLRASADVRRHFVARCGPDRKPDVPADALREIVDETTLHWMYCSIGFRRPVRITTWELDHPQTRQIIQGVIERTVPPASTEASAICAMLMGISVDAYGKWRADNESFLRMF
jgi:hypothetical protein